MELDFSLINLLILFGAVHGLIFSIILLFNKKHPGAKFLSAFMFVFAYNGFETFNWSSGLNFMFFSLVPFIIIYAAGPSLYLYLRSLLRPEVLDKKQVAKHYAIVFFQLFVRLGLLLYLIYFFLQGKPLPFGSTPISLDDAYRFYAEPLSLIVFLIYLGLSIREFKKIRRGRIFSQTIADSQATLQWTKALLTCMCVLAILWTSALVAPYFFEFEDSSNYYPVEITLVFFIYWIGFVGYHRTKAIYLQSHKPSVKTISDQQADDCLKLLIRSMETDKTYLDPELNLNKLSNITGVSAKVISLVLNQRIQKSFNEFINEYRINEFKERLLSASHKHLTISGVALESGFNSQATFQRVFKNSTGMSPREYMNLHLKKTG